jgi:RNA polymerase sigma factor (sigma-70 family)
VNHHTDQQLLTDYAERRSETAFAELVRRHADLVYSAALRMVCDVHLAEDVTQGVFVALAQNVRQLTGRPVLSGWLHRTAQNLAANVVRSDVRRRAREQEAITLNTLLDVKPEARWEQIAPHLDAALGELDDAGRDAVLLRYFERKSAREMAHTLGISDEAAQKRVSRAVERLRECLAKQGVTVGTVGLVSVLSANAIQAAPVGLLTTLPAVAVVTGKAAATAIIAQTTTTTMNWISLKSAVAMVAAALVAGTGTYLVQNREASRLRAENRALMVAREQLGAEHAAVLSSSTNSNNELELLRKDKNELIRLRGEVGALRRQKDELGKLHEENRQLRTQLTETIQNRPEPDLQSERQRAASLVKMSNAKALVMGMIVFAQEHQNQFPTNITDLMPYFTGTSSSTPTNNLNQFEMVFQGSLTNIKSPSSIIVVREKESTLLNDKWVRTYGFADGHSELKSEPPEGFEAWEKEHMIPPVSGQ